MSVKSIGKGLGAASRMMLAIAVIFSQCAWAGQRQKTNNNTTSKADAQKDPQNQLAATGPGAATQASAAQAPAAKEAIAGQTLSRGGNHEGIEVHGHWTIEVRNPDGTVVTHREFENALQGTGSTFLSLLLARQLSAGLWEITLTGTPEACLNAAGTPVGCIVGEPKSTAGQPNQFETLVASAGGGMLTLSGTAVAGEVGSIGSVETDNWQCGSTFAPATPCGRSALTVFTSTSSFPGSPIAVSAGQTIAVTVVISFS